VVAAASGLFTRARFNAWIDKTHTVAIYIELKCLQRRVLRADTPVATVPGYVRARHETAA
jgi:hypothetical protein